MKTLRLLSLVFVLSALAACGSEGGAESPDVVTAPDAVTVSDTSPVPDTVPDTAPVPDTVPAPDTAPVPDTAPLPDTAPDAAPDIASVDVPVGPCEPPGPCQQGEGWRDPETGLCSYEELPMGSPCAALEGLPGSGLCEGGQCWGFGDCDHRRYRQPAGHACNVDGECESGWCLPWGDDWAAFCAQPCGEGLAACPEGLFCVNGGAERGRYCRPLDRAHLLPGDASRETYTACNADEDCEGGLCLALEGVRFCTKDCESATSPGTADEEACGPCGRCRDYEDQFDFRFLCMPQGERRAGEPCAFGGDCVDRVCQSGLCTERCIAYQGADSCPEGMVCTQGLYADPGVRVCVPAEALGHHVGEPCEADWSCVEGLQCLEVLGESRCTFDCAGEEGAEVDCPEGICVEYERGERACLPESWLGAVGEGEACRADFECAGEAVCYRGACLVGCESDADCGELACSVDTWYRATYCAPRCATHAECPDRLSCVAGSCVLNADGQIPEFYTCRVDADCRSGLCRGGLCTDICSETLPCEGSVALPVPEWGLCKPCDPNNFGMECDESWGFSDCVQGADGAWFCATDCFFFGEGNCPVGTRCVPEGGYSAYCLPISGSCTMTASACASDGYCRQPGVAAVPCEEDADCGLGPCVAGRCEGVACETDGDCDCVWLGCEAGRCAPEAGLAIAEQEPNDTFAEAQALAGEPQSVLGTLVAFDGAPDVDLFLVPLRAGETLDVWTSPFCGQYADTHLRLFAGDGTPLEGWAFDSIDPSYPFSILDRYVAAVDETILVELTQGGMVLGNARVNYVLDVNVFTPAENDTCEGALALAGDGEPLFFDLALSNRDTAAPSCTGASAMGKDMAFAVNVPAGEALHAFADTPFDSQLYLVADCEDVNGSCVAGADAVWEAGPERLVYLNESGDDESLVLFVDSFLPESHMGFWLTVLVGPVSETPNDTVESAATLDYGVTVIEADTLGATDSYDPGEEGCVGRALPGRDAVWAVALAPGDYVTVTRESHAGPDPVLLLTSDPADPQGCLDVNLGIVHHRNMSGSAETVYLVVDSLAPDGYAAFTLRAYVGRASECFGPCESQFTPWACVASGGAALCWCDAATATLQPFDCAEYCVGDGALSGTCHSFTAPGFERDSCLCDYDCTQPHDHCERGIYTDCTCAADDPCGWTENGGCDEFCAIEYPEDYFDDTVDCEARTTR